MFNSHPTFKISKSLSPHHFTQSHTKNSKNTQNEFENEFEKVLIK
nr:MAG TPA: hypothetical protein [Caudoviricetes sp.]